jgi:hypothetical protein
MIQKTHNSNDIFCCVLIATLTFDVEFDVFTLTYSGDCTEEAGSDNANMENSHRHTTQPSMESNTTHDTRRGGPHLYPPSKV